MRALPAWLAGGPEVSDLAYDVVEHALARVDGVRVDTAAVTVRDVVDHLAAELQVDEGDVLRAFAELARAGVLSTKEKR